MRGNDLIHDDYRWLLSDSAGRLMSELTSSAADALRLAARLRKGLPAQRVHLLLEQVELRRRGRAKFAQADRMFFTPLGLEQATDEWVAAYKSQRFSSGEGVIDLCCGVGGDLMALARRGPAIGVDLDPISALLARANAPAAETAVADVTKLKLPFSAWHLDPDRRASGRRATRAEFYRPGPQAIETLLAACPSGAMKLAPAAELPERWLEICESEWISRDGACRQLVAWFGKFAEQPGQRRATVVFGNAQPPRYHSLAGSPSVEPAVASRMGRYLAEPDAAVLAAGLVGSLAATEGLAVIAPGAVYLTGDAETSSPALTWFEITDELPFDLRKLKAFLRERRIGALEIKKRGVEADPERLRRQLQVPGDGRATLFLARRGKSVTALITRRQSGAPVQVTHNAGGGGQPHTASQCHRHDGRESRMG